MTLMFLVFGDDHRNHLQANFAILTHLQYPETVSRIVVMTDSPDYYRHLSDDRVIVDEVRVDELHDWRGPHDFFWRIKIKALEQLAERYPEDHVMYTDADTFCFGDPAGLQRRLNAGETLMHAREGKLAELPTRTEREMWKQTQGNTYGGISMNDQRIMYNAGVVAIPRGKVKEAVALALRVCDDMCAAGVTRRLIEQFALSLALAETGQLGAANDTIGHYWGNKEGWNERIGQFFVYHHFASSSLATQVRASGEVDFRSIPIYSRSSGTQHKLHRLVDKGFAKNVFAYVPAVGAPTDDRSERLQAS